MRNNLNKTKMEKLKNQLKIQLDKIVIKLQSLELVDYLKIGLVLFVALFIFAGVKSCKTKPNDIEIDVDPITLNSELVLEDPNYISPYDSLSNIRILSLNCTEKDFIERQSFNTGYTNLSKTSLKRKKIVFKKGYANTDYFASKYIAQAVVKTFRDFPCLDKITILLPMEGYTKKCTITKEQASIYFQLDFEVVRQNIVVFRREFLENNKYDKYFIESFDKQYIKNK